MKKSSSYKMRIPVRELLTHTEAFLSQDVFSQTGSSVLIPGKIPISEFIKDVDNPVRIIDALERMNIHTIDIEFPCEIKDEEIRERLLELDPSVVLIDNEVTRRAQRTMSGIFERAAIDEKFRIPKSEVEELGLSLSGEIAGVTQIALSLISSDEGSYIRGHALNVSLLAGYIAKKFVEDGKGKPGLTDKTVLAGLLFDIGKATLPMEVIHKKGPLDEKEIARVRTHVAESLRICQEAGITDKDVLDGIATHHERYDGSGYPKGLVGQQIPIIGRILAVADTFDAMTSDRFYKNAVSSKISFNFIMGANETKFDPDICKIFIAGMGIYPPGCSVELSDGRVAVVAAMSAGNLLQPKVAIKGHDGAPPQVIDLAAEGLFIKRSMDMPPKEGLIVEGLQNQ